METERIGTLKSYVEGPKWADFPGFLKKICFGNDLKLEMDIDKHWISETVYFKITGPESMLIAVEKIINETIKDYNAQKED